MKFFVLLTVIIYLSLIETSSQVNGNRPLNNSGRRLNQRRRAETRQQLKDELILYKKEINFFLRKIFGQNHKNKKIQTKEEAKEVLMILKNLINSFSSKKFNHTNVSDHAKKPNQKQLRIAQGIDRFMGTCQTTNHTFMGYATKTEGNEIWVENQVEVFLDMKGNFVEKGKNGTPKIKIVPFKFMNRPHMGNILDLKIKPFTVQGIGFKEYLVSTLMLNKRVKANSAVIDDKFIFFQSFVVFKSCLVKQDVYDSNKKWNDDRCKQLEIIFQQRRKKRGLLTGEQGC